jgi:broad specificity phosphatase PhoE
LRVILLCHAATRANQAVAFPGDEPLAPRVLARSGRRPLPRASRSRTSPALRARQTAEAFGLKPVIDPAIGDWDHGRWAGRSLVELEREEPAAVAAWLVDPDAAPHGGESLSGLLRRVGAWLESQAGTAGVLAVTHAAIVRAAVIHAIGAPAACFWRLDVRPLSLTVLSSRQGQWRLQRMACSVP